MKAAIILFADTDRPEGMGRMANALTTAREFKEAGDAVAGACVYCSRAYGVKDQIEAADVPLLDDFRGHPSLRSLVADGHQIITF